MWLDKHASELDFVRNTKSIYADSIKVLNKRLWQAVGNSVVPVSLASNRPANGTIVNVPPPTLISTVPTSYSTNSTVGPLCPTAWGQEQPFNDYCPANSAAPLGYGGHDPAGCTPVAIAQLMYFWKYPATYNWGSMPLTKIQALYLPDGDMQTLIHNLGNGATTYGTTVSSTAAGKEPGMIYGQGYTSCTATESLTQQALSGAEDGVSYASLLTNELQNNKRPCIVGGYPGYNSSPCCGILPSPGGSGHT